MKPTLAPGATVGPYVLGAALGQGSTATVYRATRAGRDVALKVRGRGDPELDRRFLREFEALRGLAVPGVVRVYEAGIDERVLWYAMDLVEGVPIRTWIQAAGSTEGRVRRLLHVAPPLCDALAGVHRAGIVHRDLKPSNVLVDGHGLPHVLDFGVARAWVVADPLTGEGGLVGTLPFMAPEQVANLPLTAKADLFALGLILYEGVVGRRPRPSRPHEWLRIQCLDRTRSLATIDPEVPLSVATVIDRLLALDPRDRPDAAAAGALFRACLEGRAPREWPEPHAYVGQPAILIDVEKWLAGEGPRVRVLAGPAGSGRRRAAEQLRRIALLAGRRTVRGRCRIERPGGAVEEVLDAMLEAPADTEWRQTVGADDTGPLLEMWPHLPLEPLPGPGTTSEAQEVVRAASAALLRSAADGLLVVFEDLDEIDRFTARFLERLARVAGKELSVLCVVDDRSASRRCHRMINELVRLSLATLHRLPDLTAEQATALASALVPDGAQIAAPGGSPQVARELGLGALAAARGVSPPRLPQSAMAAAMERRPLHVDGWRALGVNSVTLADIGVLERFGPDGRVRLTDEGRKRGDADSPSTRYRVASEAARAGALARIMRRDTEAARLAAAWKDDPSPERHAAQARAYLLADDKDAAFAPAVGAAIEAERAGRYREARDWLVLVDSLPRDRESDDYARLRFSLAACRASVANAIGAERPRDDLVASALSRASNEQDRAAAMILAGDLARRKGDTRAALVVWLRIAAERADAVRRDGATGEIGASAKNLELATRASVRAAGLRVEAGESTEAAEILDRCEDLRSTRGEGLRVWKGDLDQVGIDAVRADIAMARGELSDAMALCQRGLRLASGLGHLPGIAAHSLRLGLCTWWLGDRLGAESSFERARRARIEAGDRGGAAEATAWLAWLLSGRGDVATASLLSREALMVARRLNLPDVRDLALAVQLACATLRGDASAAHRALEERAGMGIVERGPFAVAASRWWRAQGQATRALDATVGGPERGWFALELTLERARARLARGERNTALLQLDAVRVEAAIRGYRELELFARVMRAPLDPPSESTWAALVEEALSAPAIELFLWILALDGDRRADQGDVVGARRRFTELAARAAEHGHQPFRAAADEALGGL